MTLQFSQASLVGVIQYATKSVKTSFLVGSEIKKMTSVAAILHEDRDKTTGGREGEERESKQAPEHQGLCVCAKFTSIIKIFIVEIAKIHCFVR